jgi:hypothetical protein
LGVQRRLHHDSQPAPGPLYIHDLQAAARRITAELAVTVASSLQDCRPSAF